MSGEYCNIFFVLWGVQKKPQKRLFLERTLNLQKWYFCQNGLQKMPFFGFFWTPHKTKNMLQYSPDMGTYHKGQFSPYFYFFSGLSNIAILVCVFVHSSVCQNTVECDHYWDQKKWKCGENWSLWYVPMLGKYCNIFFCFMGCPKITQKGHFLEPILAKVSFLEVQYTLQKMPFFVFFWTPHKTKNMLQYSPDMGTYHRGQFSPYFYFFWSQ